VPTRDDAHTDGAAIVTGWELMIITLDRNQSVTLWQLLTNLEPPDSSVASDQNQSTKPLQIFASDAVLSAAPNPTSRARQLQLEHRLRGHFCRLY
jgi:hypothetical protein